MAAEKKKIGKGKGKKKLKKREVYM